MDQNRQKLLGFLFLLMILLLYKETVWDPYNGKVKHSETPQAVSSEPAQSSSSAAQLPSLAKPSAQDFLIKPVPEASLAPTPSVGSVPQTAQNRYPTDDEVHRYGELTIETQTLSLKLTLLGARASELRLKNYLEQLGAPKDELNLVDHTEYAPLPLGVYTGTGDDAWVQYRVASASLPPTESGGYLVGPNAKAEFNLIGTLPDGRVIQKKLSFDSAGYMIGINVELSSDSANPSRIELEWTKLIPPNSPNLLDPYNVSGYTWYDGKKASRLAFKSFPGDHLDLGNISWVSVADKYFAAALLSSDELVFGRAVRTGQLFRSRLAGSATVFKGQLFAGPKSYRELQKLGHHLEQNINLGWTAIIAAPLLQLLYVLVGLVKNYGLAIIMLTIIMKIVLLPLTATSFKQMKAMQVLQPEVKRLRETITDKAEQQQAMMQLYKEKGVNPLGGCLPIAVQIPVFIGLFSALSVAVELRHAPFALWIHDLSAPEALHIAGFGIPLMAVLLVASMIVQQVTTPNPSMDPVQKKVMLLTPVILGWMFMKMPAGLTVYYLTSNIISIAQNYALRSEGGKSSLLITIGISIAVFAFAFVLTVI